MGRMLTMALLFMEEELGPVWGVALERSLKVPCGFRGLKKVLVNGRNHVICRFKLLGNHIPCIFYELNACAREKDELVGKNQKDASLKSMDAMTCVYTVSLISTKCPSPILTKLYACLSHYCC